MFCTNYPRGSAWSAAILLFLATTFLWSCGESKPSDEFIISGTIANYPGHEQVRLDQLFPDRMERLDSAFLDDKGSFKFQRKTELGAFYQIRLQSGTTFPFYPERGTLDIQADNSNLSGWTITGNEETQNLKGFLTNRAKLFNVYKKDKQRLKFIPKAQELERWREAEKQSDASLIEFRNYLRTYIDTVSVPEFRVFGSFSMNLDANYHFLDGIRERLKEELPNHSYTGSLQQQLDLIANPFVRIEPEDIVGNAPNGEEVHLKDEVGKMTVVYFWASYCEFSRRENRVFKTLYDQYKDRGFSVFALSIDDDPLDWRTAIAQEGLNWPGHVWLQKGWNSQVFASWDVPSVPTTFLLDQRGVIVSKNIRARELQDNMDELLAKYGPKK